MIMLLIMCLLIAIFLLMLNILISKKSLQDREKISPFECGFDPLTSNNTPFSIQFFIISLIFLIFDIEITLLIPLIYTMMLFNIPLFMTSQLFMLMLILGLFLEYSEKSLEWKI